MKLQAVAINKKQHSLLWVKDSTGLVVGCWRVHPKPGYNDKVFSMMSAFFYINR